MIKKNIIKILVLMMLTFGILCICNTLIVYGQDVNSVNNKFETKKFSKDDFLEAANNIKLKEEIKILNFKVTLKEGKDGYVKDENGLAKLDENNYYIIQNDDYIFTINENDFNGIDEANAFLKSIDKDYYIDSYKISAKILKNNKYCVDFNIFDARDYSIRRANLVELTFKTQDNSTKTDNEIKTSFIINFIKEKILPLIKKIITYITNIFK